MRKHQPTQNKEPEEDDTKDTEKGKEYEEKSKRHEPRSRGEVYLISAGGMAWPKGSAK